MALRLRAFLGFARAEPLLLAAFSAAAGAVLAFVKIADEMRETETQPFDAAMLAFLHPYADHARPLGPPWMATAALDLTALGSIAVLVMIALMTGGYLLLSRRWRQAGLLALALGGGIFASEVLKGVFERARPPAGYRTFDVLNYSFPSGHALLSAVLYPTLAIMLAGALQQRAVRIYVLAIGVLLALIVGSTRVYLAAHWASDVLAGWCVGAAWAILCWIAVRLLRSRLTPSPETPAPRG